MEITLKRVKKNIKNDCGVRLLYININIFIFIYYYFAILFLMYVCILEVI